MSPGNASHHSTAYISRLALLRMSGRNDLILNICRYLVTMYNYSASSRSTKKHFSLMRIGRISNGCARNAVGGLMLVIMFRRALMSHPPRPVLLSIPDFAFYSPPVEVVHPRTVDPDLGVKVRRFRSLYQTAERSSTGVSRWEDVSMPIL